jgi:hypothetical protein
VIELIALAMTRVGLASALTPASIKNGGQLIQINQPP